MKICTMKRIMGLSTCNIRGRKPNLKSSLLIDYELSYIKYLFYVKLTFLSYLILFDNMISGIKRNRKKNNNLVYK